MIKYNVHLNGCVKNEDSDFRMGFDVTISNGGNVAEVANDIQNVINMNLERNELRTSKEDSKKE